MAGCNSGGSQVSDMKKYIKCYVLCASQLRRFMQKECAG